MRVITDELEGPRSPIRETAGPRVTDTVRAASPEASWRIRYAAIMAMLVAFAFNSDSGLVVPDTKLDLTVNPVGFLARALHLWDPQGSAGQVQDQAYGYLFPMGPFFALGHAAHLPMWAVQRLWWSALLCVAFTGVLVLAERLRIGTPAGRAVAAAAYALSPHLLTVLGPVSAEALPMCLTPWVLVPLVTGAREGSPRRAAMLSGVAVLFMGAINAGLVLAALVPPALWLLTRRPSARMWRLTGAWVLAVLLATAWWVVPLLLFGRYSVPFLGHIESSATTTSTTTLVETLRGTSDWVAYLPGTSWHAGGLLLTSTAVIVNSVVVVALGLAGVALRTAPHRAWLVTCLLVGVVIMCIGYVGANDGLAAASARDLLDGLLAPLRNVHKFDVAVRLPIVLGLAHLIGRVRWGVGATERRVSRALVMIVAAGAVAGTATPVFALRVAPAGTFAAVPGYWHQVADWLAAQHGTGRSLLVPGSRFGQYTWGAPADEPLQPLARSPWDVRSAVPLSDAGHVRMLDAVDAQLAAGRPSPGLAAYLARGGVRYLVVRNDLDLATAEVPRPVVVHAALQDSPGLSLAAAFGPPVGGDTALGGVLDQHLELPYHAVEVWAVAGPREERIQAVPADAAVQVSGGPESLLPLSDAGLPADRPAVLTGDVRAGDRRAGFRPSRVVLADGLRRREIDNGVGPLNTSATLTLDDPLRMPGHSARDFLPFAGERHQTHAQLIGAAAVRASSSASDPNAFGGSVPASQPYAAVDGDPLTAWRSNPITDGTGQWLEVDFRSPRDVTGSTIQFTSHSTASAIEVRTDAGTVPTLVPGTAPLALPVLPGPTRSLRITVTRVSGIPGPFHQVGIAELSIPGLTVQRTDVLPRDLAPGTRVDQVQMTAPDDARHPCVLVATRPLCATGIARQGEEATGLDRTVELPSPGRYTLTLGGTARGGGSLNALIAAEVDPRVVATGSSSAVAAPLAAPQAAVDGDLGTGWVARINDPRPTLTLRWTRPRTVSSLTIITDPALAATAPDTVVLHTAHATRVAAIGPNGSVSFRPLTTDRISLSLSASSGLRTNYDPVRRSFSRLGIGVSEVVVDGVPITSRAASDPRPVRLACGAGPDIVVDGVRHLTAVSTTVGALRDLRPVGLSVCTDPDINLAQGRHRLRTLPNPLWTVTGLTLSSVTAAPVAAPTLTIPITVLRWGSDDRTAWIGARYTTALVVVHENTNAGWSATLDGRRLRPITVDGWQQGYLVPAGAAGLIHLRYGPDVPYHAALIGGALAVLLLLVLMLVRPRGPGLHTARDARRRFRRPHRVRRVAGRAILAVAAVLGLPAVLGAAVLAVVASWLARLPERPRARAWLVTPAVALAALAVAVLVCGRAGAAAWAIVLMVALIADARRSVAPFLAFVMPVIAAGCYLGAGLTLAVHHWGTARYAAGSGTVQILALSAVLATALATVRAPWAVPRADDRGRVGATASPAARRT